MNIVQSADELIRFWFTSRDEYNEPVSNTVREILKNIRKKGDTALYDYTQRFDYVDIKEIQVAPEIIAVAEKKLNPAFRSILEQAGENIRLFHKRQLPESWMDKSAHGIELGQQYSPLESVGVYIPGGRAVYPSTMLMNCIPAQVAGVERIAIVSPPRQDGEISPVLLGCAGLIGINEVYRIGGAQAVGALAFGTESVKPVAKITGPGNKYVNEAKKQVFGIVGIDLPAGPTEMVILADESAKPSFIIWDLLAQAEHDPDAQTAFLTTDLDLFKNVLNELNTAIEKSPRKEIIEKSLNEHGFALMIPSVSEGLEIINKLAPEHLELMVYNADEAVKSIRNTGAIFLGNYSPGAVGDYWAGPNHTLPTDGAAAFASPLNVLDFMKFSSTIKYSMESLLRVKNAISAFAQTEQLYAHAQSVEVRNG